jgi:hypothetical protein
MPMILEIRTYRPHPGMRAEFPRAMTEEAVRVAEGLRRPH